jgi:hypothetical protein
MPWRENPFKKLPFVSWIFLNVPGVGGSGVDEVAAAELLQEPEPLELRRVNKCDGHRRHRDVAVDAAQDCSGK